METLFENLQKEADRNGESQTTPEPEKPHVDASVSASVSASVREELITLAESGKIKYTEKYLKKASEASLKKIKADYERKHLNETNDYVADNILSGVTKLLKYFDLVKDTDELKEDLKKNYLLKRDVKNIVGVITPSIPYVGLLCGGVTVGKHVALNTMSSEPSKQSEAPETK